ncbi:zinc finger protein 761-like [Orussus abietinus]|uniref:zinc finger protein 761-like n=1 Tax=Orussus abietinus TaxID=222816 RepID=UPI000C71632A|nr:zinc finger protein 761-like [Orussus abietinus]
MQLWQLLDPEGKPRYTLIPATSNSPKTLSNEVDPPNIKVEVGDDVGGHRSCRSGTQPEENRYLGSIAHLCEVGTDCFPCDRCKMKFPAENMLERHKLSHRSVVKRLSAKTRPPKSSKSLRLRSNLCDFRCRKEGKLRIHQWRRHRERPKKEGHNCTEVASLQMQKKLETKAVVAEAEEFKCRRCDFKCYEKDSLASHVWITHQEVQTDGKLSCGSCSFECKRNSTLACHINRNHTVPEEDFPKKEFRCEKGNFKGRKKDNLQPQLGPDNADNKDADSVDFRCTRCDFTCKKRTTLASHVARKHEMPERCRCDLCDFECSKKSTLYSHKRRHKVENATEFYACNECDFKTNKKSSLFSHIKRKHKDLKSKATGDALELFFCSQCDYKNKNKYELKVHVTRKHTDDFKFSCETCGKKYKIKGDLTNHIRFTHKEQPVICDVCGKTCLNSNSLYVHQKFAHYKAKFECNICKRRMVSQENLDEHLLRQHEKRENVVCEECGKTFSRNSRLKVHMRIHTGDRPYSCTVCSKSFARRTALKQHFLIHTGIRPYVCDICGKAFTQKPGLISHRKSHPGSHPPLPRVLIDHILNDVMNN